MTEEPEYLDYLEDIRDNLRIAARFVVGMTYDEFLRNEMAKYAVVHALEIVGEATKHVPSNVRRRHPDVPWKDMAGMRDRLIHGYRGTSWKAVWEAGTVDAPKYLPLIEEVLRQEEGRQG